LNEGEINEKVQRRTQLLEELRVLDRDLSKLFGVDVASLGDGRSGRVRATRRKSLPAAARAEKTQALLKAHPEGLSAKRIANELGDSYAAVQVYLKSHPELFVRSGEKKSTVYRLKA
jgi:hypothetical protein